MSDESRRLARCLRDEERELILALLSSGALVDEKLRFGRVIDLPDGGMGSIQFLHDEGAPATLGATISEAEYVDADGIPVSIALNVDTEGRLFELDIWKVNFSPLIEYPTGERVRLRNSRP